MGNSTELRYKNILEIIRTIKKRTAVSKPEIARLTGLTTVTAHNLVKFLVQCGMLTEAGTANPNGGRKASLYSIQGNYAYIPGVLLDRSSITVTIHDFCLNMIYKNIIPCKPENTSQTLEFIAQCVQNALSDSNIDKEKCIGLGVAVPGKVNKNSGVIITLPDIRHWDNIPIRSIIQSKTGITTYADNDSNARAMSAKWSGSMKEDEDAVLLNITSGVGIGVLSKGKILYGSHSYAGELGHTTIQYNGPVCSCGNRGCIEALTTDQAIISKVGRLKDIGGDNVTIADIIALAKDQSNQEVYNVLRETAYFISIALDHIFKTYDPHTIILQNNWLIEFPDLYYYMLETLFARCPWMGQDIVRISLDSGDSFEDSSAACIVLEKLMTYSPDNILVRRIEETE